MRSHARGMLLLILTLLLQRKAAAAAAALEATLDAGAAAGGTRAVEVRSERELLVALHDQTVGFITLQRSIRLTKPGGRVQVTRKLTISGPVQQPGATAAAAGPPVAIDFAHRSGVLLVSPGVLLTLQHLLLLGSVITWSPGLGCIDHLPGARVRLVRVVRPNPFCPPDASWLARGMQSTPVPPGYSPPPELYDAGSRGPFTNSMVLWSLAECRAAWLWPDTCQAVGGFSQQLAYEMPSQLDNRLAYSYRESMGLYDYFDVYFPCANRVDPRCVAARGYPACFNQRIARHIRQAAWADSKGRVGTSLFATAAAACAAYFWWRRQQQQQQQQQQALQLEGQQQQQQLSGQPLMRGYVPATPDVLLFQRSADKPLLASVVNCSSSGSLVMNDVTFGSLIGCGSFGRVYKGDVKGQAVAIKVIDMAASGSIKTVQQELDVGTHVQHRNIVRCFSYEIRSHKVPGAPNSDGSTSQPTTQTTTATGSDVSCGAFNSSSPSSSGAKEQQEQQQQQQQQQQKEPQQQQVSDRTMCAPVISGGGLLLPDASDPGGHQPLTQVLMLLEFCDGGSLHAAAMAGLLRAGRCNNMDLTLRIALDVARGMQHLHTAKIVHGDLTSHNILLSSSRAVPEPLRYEAKVADFGLSRLLPETGTHLTTAMHGTITHQAPEVLQTGRIRLASDVYSFGVLLWELVHLGTPQQPGADSSDGAHVGSSGGTPVIRGVYQHMASLHASWLIAQKVVEGMRPEFIAPAVPGPYIALAKRCWSTDPAQRPTFSDIVELLEGYVHGHRNSSSEGDL